MPTKYDNWTAIDAIDKSLLDNDIHYLHGDITNENVSEAIKWIVSANLSKKPKRKLILYVNSYGGDLYEAFALIDVMKHSYHPIATVGIGAVMSAAFLIFVSGQHGSRTIGKNAGIMNHQHSSEQAETKMHDMKAAYSENVNCEARALGILREASGMTLAEVRKKLNSPTDQYFTAKQMIDMKLADAIM
jgi:ATP-dependent protease ClpP protease subunit